MLVLSLHLTKCNIVGNHVSLLIERKGPQYRGSNNKFTLNAPIATKVVCFSRLLKSLRSLYGKQCGPRPDCSYRSSLFWVYAVASILNLSVMLGNYLQQTTSADDIFRCIFFLVRFKG